MGVLLVAIAVVIVAAAAMWWLPTRGWWVVLAAVSFLTAITISWFAEQLDNGVPWNPDRPLLTTGGWAERAVIFLLLYGPFVLGLWCVKKARR